VTKRTSYADRGNIECVYALAEMSTLGRSRPHYVFCNFQQF